MTTDTPPTKTESKDRTYDISSRSWLFGRRVSAEEEERRTREQRVRDLLPDEEDSDLGKAYDGQQVSRLVTYLKPYRTRTIVAVILMVVSSLCAVSLPWIIGQAIDQGIRAESVDILLTWTILYVVASILQWFTDRGSVLLMAYVGTKIVADMRSDLFKHLHTLSLSFHNNYSVGRLMSRLISDVGVLQDFVTWSITGLTRSAFMLTGITIAMLLLNWKLALVTFSVMPLMIILTNYWRKRVRNAYRATRARLSLINGYLNESISGIRVTQAYTREEENFKHFDTLNLSYFNANIEATKLTALFFPGVDLIGSIATALVVGVGGLLVLGDQLTAGVLIAFVLYVDRFFDPIRELAQRYNTFQATMAGSERIFNLLDTQPEISDAEGAITLPKVVGQVEFKHVDFWYKPDEIVLNDFSLHADPGERVALVGETGAGKSTVVRLLARFFDVSGGEIEIDGNDIRDVTQQSLRSQLGIVLQDPFLFSGSIAENIRYGKLDATEDEVITAAKAVGAHEFIERMPDKYESDVGEDGVNLSGGQRQLVSFARALLADPRILVLDEATSSVDTATEKQIEFGLDQLMKGRTSFVIAHRLSTIVDSDQIVVMDHGEIVETGKHEELLAEEGRYYNLYTMQWAEQNDVGDG